MPSWGLAVPVVFLGPVEWELPPSAGFCIFAGHDNVTLRCAAAWEGSGDRGKRGWRRHRRGGWILP